MPPEGLILNTMKRVVLQNWETKLQGLKSWAWIPKFWRTFDVLQNLSSTGFLLCETFRRNFLQNPKGSAEFGEPLGARTRLLRTGFFSSRKPTFFGHCFSNVHTWGECECEKSLSRNDVCNDMCSECMCASVSFCLLVLSMVTRIIVIVKWCKPVVIASVTS